MATGAGREWSPLRIFITSLGDPTEPTVPASSTRRLLRNQEFAMVTFQRMLLDDHIPCTRMTL